MKLFKSFLIVSVALICASIAHTATTNGVRIGSYFFNPTNLVISPGDRVVWTNTVALQHDTTRSGLWASGLISSNGTFGFTFTNLGYYPYLCQQHANALAGHLEQTGSVSVVTATLAAVSNVANGVRFDVRGGRQGLRAAIDAGTDITTLTPIATNPFPASGTLGFTNANPLPSRRFYRARVIP